MENDNEVKRLKYIIDSLFRCIRDGIELNYESWVVWQAVARGVLAFDLPDRMKEINRIDRCMKIYLERLDSFRNATNEDILESARETIAMFDSM